MGNEAAVTRVIDEGLSPGERTIGDIAGAYGLSLRTLRFYEDRGLLQPRRQGTARFYSAADRVRLELILKGKRLGFTLGEIYDLIITRSKAVPEKDEPDLALSLGQGKIAAQITHLERQRDDLEAAIDELRDAMKRMLGTAHDFGPSDAASRATGDGL